MLKVNRQVTTYYKFIVEKQVFVISIFGYTVPFCVYVVCIRIWIILDNAYLVKFRQISVTYRIVEWELSWILKATIQYQIAQNGGRLSTERWKNTQ